MSSESDNKMNIEEKSADKKKQSGGTSMNKNTLGILICAGILVLTLLIYLIASGGSGKKEKASESQEAASADIYSEIGDGDTSGVKTDSKKENKPWKNLTDDQYGVGIQLLSQGYSGEFIEDGTDEEVKNVLSLKFTNNASQDIQYAEYVFDYGDDIVSFKLSDLPKGQSCVVLEAGRHEYEKKDILELKSRVVAQVDEIPFAREQILVVDNSDNSLTIMNLTENEIPVVRVFYKNYDSEDNVFFGGITYTAMAENIPAGSSVTIQPEHFLSGDSVVVGTGIYSN